MFNSVSFNVVLGLILIYLLYSLLSTLLSEIIATALGIRARILRLAIERMLTDGFDPEYIGYRLRKRKNLGNFWIDWVRYVWYLSIHHWRKLFLAKPKYQKYSLAGRFYNYPSIKYLAEHSANTRSGLFQSTLPAYISASQFASAIISMMKGKGQGLTTWDRLCFCLRYNTLHMEYQSRSQFQDLLDSSRGSVDVFDKKLQSWFNETMDRANGWYKLRIRTLLFALGFLLASTFNIDTLYIATTLSKDTETSRQLSELSVQVARDTTLRNAATTTSIDSMQIEPPSQTVADSNYARLTSYLLASSHILGLGWDAGDRYTPYTNTWNNISPDLLPTLAEDSFLFGNLSRRFALIKTHLKEDRNHIRSANDSALATLRDYYLSRIHPDTLDAFHRLALLRRETVNYRKAYYVDTLAYRSTLDSINIVSDSVGVLFHTHRLRLETMNLSPGTLSVTARRYYGLGRIIVFTLFTHPWSLNSIIGFLLTSLAVSLGAPFWFNLLVKLASIRGAGNRPDDKIKIPGETNLLDGLPENTGGEFIATTTVTTIAVPGPDQTWELEVVKVSTVLQNMPGFLRTAKGWKGGGNRKGGLDKTPAVEVQVLDEKSIIAAKGLLKTYQGYPLVYKLNTPAVAHAFTHGNTVYNDHLPNEIGSLGCFATRRDMAGLYFLTCWHVLKGDYNYNERTSSWKNIVLYKDGTARLTDGCLADTIDVAFAELPKSVEITNTLNRNYRAVTIADARSTPITFKGTTSGERTGYIDMHSTSVSLKYPDGNNYSLNDVLQICSYDENFNAHPISAPGDSGSLVIDDQGYPLGLIVGGDTNYTYVVKFSNFLDPKTGLYKEYVLYT